MFCECKWQNRKTDIKVFKDLMEKSGHVEWGNNKRKDHYVVISKSGFTWATVRFAEKNDVYIFTLQNMCWLDE